MKAIALWGVAALAFTAAACETKPNAVPAPVATLAVEPTAAAGDARGLAPLGGEPAQRL